MSYVYLFDGLYKGITPSPTPRPPPPPASARERGLLTLGRFASIWIHAYFRFSTTQNSLPNLAAKWAKADLFMGTSFIKFGLKKASNIWGNIIPILGKFPWDLYWENKTFKLKRTIPCEKKTIKWASKLAKKNKGNGKIGTTSRIFVHVFCCCCCLVVCLFVCLFLRLISWGIELNFYTDSFPVKAMKTWGK